MDRKSITAVIRWGNGSTTEVCKAIIGSNRCARRTRCASETKRNNAVSVDAPWSPRPSRAGVRNVRHRSSLATFQSGPFKRFGAEPLHTLSTVKRPSDRMPRTAALAGSSSSFMQLGQGRAEDEGASRLARAGVLEHTLWRSYLCFDRRVVRNQARSTTAQTFSVRPASRGRVSLLPAAVRPLRTGPRRQLGRAWSR